MKGDQEVKWERGGKGDEKGMKMCSVPGPTPHREHRYYVMQTFTV